ncbi:zinc metallopeptidase [Caldicellulosiruptor changbaiensis]|uniref:Zinc metallopeptidase n=1 Tax=Caldicellulosiruptor changbaiensis TaxID=1222016 RepID=A0A3T0D547_9FIRM|nr:MULTISPECIES: zinc metallopeptidase [Caldicellulosiruptor]AZT90179.1 zinc metallopeptidase [Caldicellulosiruptor changbaiensis]
MFYYFDPMYLIFAIPAFLISIFAQIKVQAAFSKYSKMRSFSGLTGAEVAKSILWANGIYDVKVEYVPGLLTDHYDPRFKVLRLSSGVFDSNSIAAIGVAAHEAGHAIQHYERYPWLSLRSAMVPVVNIGSNLAFPLILIGLLFRNGDIFINLGILLFCLAVLFTLITLPVEVNASKRAIQALKLAGVVMPSEEEGVKKVLRAAAMTYVAAVAVAILQLLYYLSLVQRRRDD